MPIRINLLAEEQALEELRRRDPVKRVILAGIVLVALMLTWSLLLFAQNMARKSELANLESEYNSRTNSYGQIILNQNNLIEDKQKLGRLQQLATNRFLLGSLLNALQNTTVDNVQLVRLKVTQTYLVTEEVRPRPNSGDERTVPKPASATEKIVLTLNAKDNSPVPGESVKKLQDALAASPYFKEILGGVNSFGLIQRGTPQTDPDGKSFVLFTLEAQLPERKR
jgi:hypothetical protein